MYNGKNPKLFKAPALKMEYKVQNMALQLYASHTTQNSTFLMNTFLVHSTSFSPHLSPNITCIMRRLGGRLSCDLMNFTRIRLLWLTRC